MKPSLDNPSDAPRPRSRHSIRSRSRGFLPASPVSWVLAVVVLAAGAVIDFHTPRGFSDWALYIIPMLLMMRTASNRRLLMVAGAGSLLTIVGFIVSPPGALVWVSAGSRVLGLTLIWTIVLVSRRWHEADDSVLRANRALRVLSECNQELVRAADEQKLLDRICRVVVEIGGYRMAWVGSAEHDEAQRVRPVAFSGCEEGYLASAQITWADRERGRGPTGTAIRTGEPCLVQDTLTDPRMAPWRAEAIQRGFASCIGLPLITDGKPFGALTIYAREANAFDPSEIELLNELARDLAYGIGALRTRAERQQAEAALRRSEANLEEAQHIAHVGSWDWDVVNDRAWWSDEMYRLFGLAPHSFAPNLANSLALFHPDDRARVKQALEEALEAGTPYSLDYHILHADGSERAVHAQGGVIRSAEGKPVRMFGTLQDITERKRAEEALRQREQLLSMIYDSASDLVWVMAVEPNETYRCVSISRSYLEATGLREEALVGKRLEEILQTAPFQLARTKYRAAIHARRTIRYEEDANVPTGHVIVETRLTPIFDVAGNCTHLLGVSRDITERKRAEEALRDSEERFRSLVENATVGIYRTTRDGRILMANPALAKMMGFTSPEELTSRNLEAEGFEPNYPRDEFKRRIEQEGEVRGLESAWTRQDGSVIHVRESASIVRDAEGNVRFYDGIVEDITERKRAEERTKESEERFRKAFMTGADAFYISTLEEGRLIEANDRFEEMFGYRREEAMGKTPLELGLYAVPADRDRMVAELKSNGSVRNLELTGRQRSGEPITVLLSANLLAGANGQMILGVIRDVTEQKRAEQALVRLRKAVDASGEAIFMTDKDGIIRFINPEFTRLYGYTEEEVAGNATPRILKSGMQQPEDYASFWKNILDKRVVRGEVINKTKDGRLVAVQSSANPVLDESGNIMGFLAIQRDVTERKQLEEQFRQAQKMEAVGRLAGGVAHDFNNLLTIINGYAQLLREREDLAAPAREQLGQIQKAGERASSLTQQLLAFSRKQVMEPKVLNLNSVMEGMEKMLRRLIGEDVELKMAPGKGLGQVKTDPTQIEQVMMNLVVNARDAMPHGGKLILETANAQLDESYARTHVDVQPGAYVMLAVSDTGHGMDAETTAHIFEPFFTTKQQGKGTGLGLSTVYGIVKQSGGHVAVYSELGKGTTFKIYLPRLDQPAEAPDEKGIQSGLEGSETVLVVEDEAGVRSLIQSVLERHGYRVLLAGTPEEAAALSERLNGQIDLLLTDVIMPGFSGKDLADHLAFSRPNMKVLFISGYTADAIAHHGVLDDKVQFLQKPFTPSALLHKVRTSIDRIAE